MTENPFAKFIPGFDFLQGLAKNAGTHMPQMPGMGQWVAPTLNPEELDKRITELKAVQYWLDQNAKMLGVTIQALEVQRMTLATLKTMNVPMGELSEALKFKPVVPEPVAAPAPKAASAPQPAAKKPARKTATKTTAKPSASTPPAIDPMKWWGALSEQFGHLAAGAVKDISAAAVPPVAAKKAPARKKA